MANPILSLHRSFFSKKCEGSSHWLWRARWKVTLAWLLFRLWANREKKLGRNRWQKKQEGRTPEKLIECFCLLPLFQLLWRPACFLDSLEFQEFSIINQVYRFLISTEAACAREWNMDVYCGYFHSTFPSLASAVWQEKQEPRRLKRKKQDCIHSGYESVGKGWYKQSK